MLKQEIKKFINTINESQKILLVTHRNPDGDAIGSILAMQNYLLSLNKGIHSFCITKPGENFNYLQSEITNYLSGKEIYLRDAYVCADPKYKTNVRTVTEYPWSNLFTYNMFLRSEESELENFEEDWLVLCAPGYEAPDPKKHGLRQGNFSILNFTKKIALIGGSAYTGEIKKGIFSSLNFILPVEKDVLPMHCSANVGEAGDTAIFFGLSGTGKTTLSADPTRKLIGDDEHGWTANNNIFNFEGGCYAKVIDLSEEKEPDIYRAIKPGAILENVVFKASGEIDYMDSSITQNTRVSYPIYHIDNIQKPSYAGNPTNIFFLTADAFGVLPPVSKLTPGQAAYHFISGYTAKVAGTEAGITSLQMDIKIAGITPAIMKEALAQAKVGRVHILGEMNKALSSASEFSEHAPRIETMQIPVDKIREVIGSGGKVIREIVEMSGAKVDINDEGIIKIASPNGEAIKKAYDMIWSIVAEPEEGMVYTGTVVKIVDFGAFVNFFGKKDGLVHVSQIKNRRLNHPSDVLKEGQEVKVKLLGFDDRGKVRLSMKVVDQVTGEEVKEEAKED
jgi:predicted RNA-binding protein with RPS1 domain